MADIFRTQCRCGYRGEEMEGRLENGTPRIHLALPVKRPSPNAQWDDYDRLGHFKEDGFDKELFELFETTQSFSLREKIYAWLRWNADRSKPRVWRYDKFWFLKDLICRIASLVKAQSTLVPYERRSLCPQCKRTTLKWYHVACAD